MSEAVGAAQSVMLRDPRVSAVKAPRALRADRVARSQMHRARGCRYGGEIGWGAVGLVTKRGGAMGEIGQGCQNGRFTGPGYADCEARVVGPQGRYCLRWGAVVGWGFVERRAACPTSEILRNGLLGQVGTWFPCRAPAAAPFDTKLKRPVVALAMGGHELEPRMSVSRYAYICNFL